MSLQSNNLHYQSNYTIYIPVSDNQSHPKILYIPLLYFFNQLPKKKFFNSIFCDQRISSSSTALVFYRIRWKRIEKNMSSYYSLFNLNINCYLIIRDF